MSLLYQERCVIVRNAMTLPYECDERRVSYSSDEGGF